MQKRAVYSVVIVIVIALAALTVAYATGFEATNNSSQMTVHLTRVVSSGVNMISLESESGKVLGEFNYTIQNQSSANETGTTTCSLGFQLWHAPGLAISSLNITFSLPWPAKVWVTQLNYFTDGNAPLQVKNINYSAPAAGFTSGAVLTLSRFPTMNPTVEYGIGLQYQNGTSTVHPGNTSVEVQLILSGGSPYPFIGETYNGEFGFNLARP